MEKRRTKILFVIGLVVLVAFSGISKSLADTSLTVTQIAPLTVRASWTFDLTLCDDPGAFGYLLQWGDGTSNQFSVGSGTAEHTYPSPGTYTVRLLLQTESATSPPGCSPQQTITVTGGDSVPPTITIISPTSSPSYTTSTPSITLAGTASDNVGVTQITWANDKGGSGTAAGTTAWTAAGINLQSGSNVITVTAHDAAGNTGTDQLTVTYTPPAGAFNVIPSPSSSGVVPWQSNSIPVIYTGTAAGGATLTATSSQGQFVTQSGTVLGSINSPVSIHIAKGTGTAPENVIIPASIISAALNAKQNRILYRRTFTSGANSATTEVALQIVPPSAGPFSLVRMTLQFIQESESPFLSTSRTTRIVSLGRVTVPRNSTGLKAEAHIVYNGGGLLTGQWKVDGQIIGYVAQYLYPGIREATVRSPDVPGLPTYDTGQHSVELEILQPIPPFDEPVIYYFVTGQEEAPPPLTLQLISPDPNATVPLAGPGGTGLQFRWQTLSMPCIYHFEIYPAYAAAPHGANLPFGGAASASAPTPIVSADTEQGTYTLAEIDAENLQPGVEYVWHVSALQENTPVASSEDRHIIFEAPQAQGGEPYFEYLHIIQTTPLQQAPGTQDFSPTEPQSHWFHFGPKSAYAMEIGPSGLSSVGTSQMSTTGTEGQGSAEIQVSQGMNVTIRAGLKNPGTQEKRNVYVQFLVDGEAIDVSFVPVLAPGQLVVVETTYEVPDSYSHTVEVRASEVSGEQATVFASIGGYLANEQGEQTHIPTEPPEEGYWIGAFNLKPANVTNPDPDNFTGSGVIEIPFMSEYPVDFSGLKINEEEKKVTEGEVRLELGEHEIEIGPASVYLTSIIFQPDRATCEGHAQVPLIFSPDPLELSLADLIVQPEGLSGKLKLQNQATFSLTDPLDFSLTLDSNSYIRVSHNQLVGSSLNGSVQVPDQFLNFLGNVTGIQFSGFGITTDGGLYGEATLPETQIGGTNISVSGTVVIDLTSTKSPGNLGSIFKGIYLKNARLRFPSEITLPDLSVSGFYVDGTGVNGRVSLSDLGLDLDVAGFSGGIESITIAFDHNALIEGALAGDIHVPFIEADFGFSLLITAIGVETLDLTVAQDKSVRIDAMFLNLVIAQGSRIGIENGVGKARLNGSISTLQGAPIQISQIDFQNLIIDALGDVDLSEGWIPIGNHHTAFHGFPFTLTKVGLGKDDSKYFLGLQGGLSICPEIFALSADTRIKILATKSGNALQYDSTNVDKIFVEFGVPHAFNFMGEVEWYESDPVYGRGFKGDMVLSAADLFRADATLRVGNTGSYFYFFIHGDVAFPGGGVPLSPLPLSVYGFNGGAFYNVAPPNPDIGEAEYVPEHGRFGLMAGIDMGTYDGGYTFNAKLVLMIEVNPVVVTMTGDGWVLTKITDRSSSPSIEARLQLTFDPFVLTASLGVSLDFHGIVLIPASGQGTAQADLKFSEEDWYINIGTKESPISIRALYMFSCAGYFDIGSTGIAMGFEKSLHAGGRWWIFYGYLDTGLKADVAVGYNPFFIYGEVAVWLDVRAGIHVDVWFWEGDIDIINAGVSADLGVRAPNPTKIWGSLSAHFSVLGGIVHGSFSMSFSWSTGAEGEVSGAGGEELQLPPAIVYTCPQNGSTDVPLAAKFFVKFPMTEGEIRTVGDWEYRVRFSSLRLFGIFPEAGGARQPVYAQDKGIGEDRMTAYFYPRDILTPGAHYRLEAVAYMEKRFQGGPWQIDGDYEFASEFQTGEMAQRWDQYVRSVYPRPGQKYVYTNSDIDVLFAARMPDDLYHVGVYKKAGGGWEEVVYPTTQPHLSHNRDRIHCEAYDPAFGYHWAPTTNYELRVYKRIPDGQGGYIDQEVYTLPFKTSAYENFAQMIHASPFMCNARLAWGLDQTPPYLFRVISFDTVEPINWKDMEKIILRPIPGWTGTAEVEHRLGYAEILVQRDVRIFGLVGNAPVSMTIAAPVKISCIVNFDGAHHRSWDTLQTIRYYIDFTNIFFTPDLDAIQAELPWLTVRNAFVTNYTLSNEEKQELWSALQMDPGVGGENHTLFQVYLRHRSIDESFDPLNTREARIQLHIPHDKLGQWR
ncbi:MAG: hypothetical protein JRF46_05520 [Deltaproteobacteria bacterium]|nr:hypothetical protein [Deltaproteobacteria bacterium]